MLWEFLSANSILGTSLRTWLLCVDAISYEEKGSLSLYWDTGAEASLHSGSHRPTEEGQDTVASTLFNIL